MPLFRYIITHSGQTKTTELRKSNPQGWLLEAVGATFPEVAKRRGDAVLRLRLEPINGAKQAWCAVLPDSPTDLSIEVVEARR